MRILSCSLRLKSERRVGRGVEEELRKDSEKDKGLGRGEVPRNLPSGTFCLPLDNENYPKEDARSLVTLILQTSVLRLLLFDKK